MDKLVLIDGNSLLNRAYFATPIFSTQSGQPTNAIFGFIKLTLKILSDLNPEYIIVTFDLKAPTFRHEMYKDYKAGRKPMPEELAVQIPQLKSLLSAMKIAICEKEGYEADDIIGTLSKRFSVHSYIYTGDRDSFQLVDDSTDVYYTRRGVSDLQRLSADNFKSETGITPKQVIDLKALMGDASDNIPGVEGIGEVTAKKLLDSYATLDGIYENIELVSRSVREKLINGKDSAYFSYQLATINRDCDISIELDECRAPVLYSGEVKRLFREFEFKSLLKLDIFEEDDDESTESNINITYPEIIVCESDEQLDSLFTENGSYAIDLGTSGAKILFKNKLYQIECEESLTSRISLDCYINVLRCIFSDEKNNVTAYDCKKLLHAIRSFGIEVSCTLDDLSVVKYLADYFEDSKNFEELCVRRGFDLKYSAFAVQYIFDGYLKELCESGTEKLYFEIERPLISVLCDMEEVGVKIDTVRLDEISTLYLSKIEEIRARIYEMCGCKFNINSPSQLGSVLFEKLGLKAGKKSKGGKYSTNADVLEKLAEENEVVKFVLEYRTYQKLYSTYIDGFRPLIDKTTKLVHTTFNQTVTSTGRLSSANPNLQNIPVREEVGRELRKMFVARDGNLLIDADYSQIELRLLAHFSGCKELIQAYENDFDVHAFTASQVFNVPIEEVTSKMRREAKAVNFGIIYGISEFGLAKQLDIDVRIAREYISRYFDRYSDVKAYMESNVEFAKQNGYVSTLSGRKRYIKEINSENFNLRQFGERAARNMPLQGSSADIIKIAMINVHSALEKEGLKTKLILQVHDELVLDAPENEVVRASEILKEQMENAVKLNVPLKVDIHTGRNWYEAK